MFIFWTASPITFSSKWPPKPPKQPKTAEQKGAQIIFFGLSAFGFLIWFIGG